MTCNAATIDVSSRLNHNETSELERLGDEIAELAAHIHAATYRLLVSLREFDERGGWWCSGFRSCAHWLSWRTGIGLGAARERVRVARALAQLPRLSDGMRRGELSFAKIRATTRVATPENEEQLLELARQGTASHVEKIVRAWRRVDRLEEQFKERERHQKRELTLYIGEDGMYELRGRLDPEVGALLERALAAANEALNGRREAAHPRDARVSDFTDSSTVSQRRADAIGLIAECALRNGLAANSQLQGERAGAGNEHVTERSSPATVSRADRFQVVVHVDAEALHESSDCGQSVLADGVRVSAETSRRLACDASRVVMVHDEEGRVLDVGRRTRTIPPAIRRALEHRDRGCRFPGCSLRFCDAHHVKHWADGGVTSLENTLLLCRFHHRAVHEDGFRIVVTEEGGFRFLRPDGRPLPDAPCAPSLPEDATSKLAAVHRELGLEIDASTAMSGWMGERLDLGYAVFALRGGSSAHDQAGEVCAAAQGPGHALPGLHIERA